VKTAMARARFGDRAQNQEAMNSKTEELLARLGGMEWFSRAGLRDFEPATQLNSWKEAILFATDGRQWEAFRLERRNELTVFLHNHAMDRYRKWNEITAELRSRVAPMVHSRVANVTALHNLPDAFESCVRWDILGACMESEYSDLRTPGFYTELAAVYLKGHFPCGWDGLYPAGHFLVY
jgi:hypothetical protein